MAEDFRDTFYSSYYRNQEGRRSDEGARATGGGDQKIRDQFLPYLPADSATRILDAGCGTGRLLEVLEEEGYRNLEGIDISGEQVEVARRRGVTNVEQADIFEFLQRSERKWDVILAMDLIEHFPKKEAYQLLKLIYRHLDKEGLFIARTPNIDTPFGSVYAYGDITHGMILNRSSAEQLMKTVGFDWVEIDSESPAIQSGFKGLLQRVIQQAVRWGTKAVFFGYGRSMRQVELGANLLITARKKQMEDGG